MTDPQFLSRGEAAPLLAPNGQPSNLTPVQWRQVRTAVFKQWFGEWELPAKPAAAVVTLEAVQIRSRNRALAYAREHLQGVTERNADTGLLVGFGRQAIDKAFSESSARQSVVPEHFDAARALRGLVRHAVLGESHPDRRQDPNLKAIHRFFAALRIGRELFRVKLTVKEYVRERAGFYTHQLTRLEVPAGLLAAQLPEHAPLAGTSKPTPGQSGHVKIAELLRGATRNNGTPLAAFPMLDANGEPLVVNGSFINARGERLPAA